MTSTTTGALDDKEDENGVDVDIDVDENDHENGYGK